MNDLSSYLLKFRTLLVTAEERKKIIADILLQTLNVFVDPKNIIIKDNQVEIRASASAKSELFIYKKKITDLLSKSLNLKVTIR